MIKDVVGARYEIIEKIGEGGMAIVYKARCRVLDRLVALKVLKAQYAEDADFVERFRNEALSAAKLTHPNIVSIFDVGVDDGLHYIVMELVDGYDLKEIIKREAPLEEKRALKYVRQILSALKQAHAAGIVHRDIKPQNIIITANDTVKVTDFGIAKAVGTGTMVHTGTVIGSVHYLSPEQARGGIVDARTDIYSLGVLFYELMTGKMPFNGDNPIQVALMHLKDIPPMPSALNPGINKNIEAIILKAMAKEPQQRFSSSEQMLKAVDAAAEAISNGGIFEQPLFELSSDDSGPTQKFGIDGETLANISKISKKKQAVHKKKQVKKKIPVKLIIAMAVIAVLVIAGVAIGGMLLSVPDVKVPLIEGSTMQDAQDVLKGVGLKLVVERKVEDNSKNPGTIVYQEQRPGATVKNGSSVLVVLNGSDKKYKVPDVVGESYDNAVIMLKNKGFMLGKKDEVFDDKTAKGDVMSQNPQSGEMKDLGQKVDLVVSKGAEPVPFAMPQFIGMDLQTAKSVAAQNGLVIEAVQADNNPQYAAGVVSNQQPDSGLQVNSGDKISLWANSSADSSANGKDVNITVPDGYGSSVVVRIVLTDSNGAKEIYRQTHASGDTFTVHVTWSGDNASIDVYAGNDNILNKALK